MADTLKVLTEARTQDLIDEIKSRFGGKADKATTLEGYGITDGLTATEIESKIDAAISSVYKPSGTVTFSNLPALAVGVLGNVYNVSDAFNTTADFVEGAGNSYPAGTNVVVVQTGNAENPAYKFDVLSGFVDLSSYYNTTSLQAITSEELQAMWESE